MLHTAISRYGNYLDTWGKRQTTQPIREAIKQKRQEMKALWEADVPDRAAILAVASEMAALKQQMQVARIDFRLGLHGVLTPDQRAQMREHKRGKRGKWGKHGKRGKRGEGRRHRGGDAEETNESL